MVSAYINDSFLEVIRKWRSSYVPRLAVRDAQPHHS